MARQGGKNRGQVIQRLKRAFKDTMTVSALKALFYFGTDALGRAVLICSTTGRNTRICNPVPEASLKSPVFH